MEEIWKDAVGYEGQYKVSNLCKVQSVDRFIIHPEREGQCEYKQIKKGRMLKQVNDALGYCYVFFSKNGVQKQPKVHRLVAQAFIPNPEGKATVNHIDFNKSNNKVSNLEWCTHQENIDHFVLHGTKNTPKGERHKWYGKRGSDFHAYGEKNYGSKIVLDFNTGIYYTNGREAAELNGVIYSTMRSRLQKNNTSFRYV